MSKEIEQLLTDEVGPSTGLDADWCVEAWVIGSRDDEDCRLVLAIIDDESDMCEYAATMMSQIRQRRSFSLVLRTFDLNDQAIDSRINYSFAHERGVAALISEGLTLARIMGMQIK
ncbi:MAG: hypothetical protein ACPHJ3_06635 [Rubripirellula sp.]